MLGPLGLPEIALIAGLVVLLFGAKKIPELARSLGKGIKEFKTGIEEANLDESESSDEDSKEKPSE